MATPAVYEVRPVRNGILILPVDWQRSTPEINAPTPTAPAMPTVADIDEAMDAVLGADIDPDGGHA
mgnify:FL=1